MNPIEYLTPDELVAKATEYSGIGTWCRDVQTNEVWFSPQWKHMIGYKDHEIPNKYEEWLSRIHPDDRDATDNALNDYLSGRSIFYSCDYRLEAKGGTYVTVRSKGKKIEGTPFFLGTHEDLSHSRDKEVLYRKILDSLDLLVFVKERRKGAANAAPIFPFVFANQALAAGYAETLDSVVGKTDEACNTNAQQVEHFWEYDEKAFQEGRIELPVEELTLLWKGKKQTLRLATTKCRFDFTNRLGETRQGIIGWSVPINTSQYLDVDELNAFFDALPDPVFMKNLEHKFCRVNAATVDLAEKATKAELIGKDETAFPWIDSGNYAVIAAMNEENIKRKGKAEESLRKVTHKSTGAVRERLIKKAPIFNETGQVTGFVGVIRDVTRFQNDLTEHLLTDCTLLLSHGTKKRLGHIYTQLSDLYEEATAESSKERCIQMRAELNVLGARSENAIHILRSLSNSGPIPTAAVDLAQAIRALLDSGFPEDLFELDLSEKPCIALTHERYLLAGIEELLFNAVDALQRKEFPSCAGPEDRPKVRLWVVSGFASCGPTIQIHIRDNGPGIGFRIREGRPPEPLASCDEDIGGTGVGLFAVYRMLERLNGTLASVETEGVGTHLKIEIPAVAPR